MPAPLRDPYVTLFVVFNFSEQGPYLRKQCHLRKTNPSEYDETPNLENCPRNRRDACDRLMGGGSLAIRRIPSEGLRLLNERTLQLSVKVMTFAYAALNPKVCRAENIKTDYVMKICFLT